MGTVYGGRYKGHANTGGKSLKSFSEGVDKKIQSDKEKETFREANTIKPDYYFQGQKMEEKDYNLAVMAAKGNKGKIAPGTSPALDQLRETQEAQDIKAEGEANAYEIARQNDVAIAQQEALKKYEKTESPVGQEQAIGTQPIGQTGEIPTQDTTGGLPTQETDSLLPYNKLKAITGEKFAEDLSNFVLSTQAETKKSGVFASSMNIGQRFIKGLVSFTHAKGTNADFNNAEDVTNTWIGMIDKEIKEGNDPIIVNQYLRTAEDSLSAMEDEAKYYGFLNAGYWKNQGADLQTAIMQKRKMIGDLRTKAEAKSIISNYGL